MANRQRRVVVVIEDNAGINDVLSDILEELGCRIVPVTDGLEAMEAARLYRPDLITLDLMLPGRDGWAVARELHEAPETGHIPIVIITAHPSEVDPTLGSRVAAVFPKPFNVADVMREIEAILRRRAD